MLPTNNQKWGWRTKVHTVSYYGWATIYGQIFMQVSGRMFFQQYYEFQFFMLEYLAWFLTDLKKHDALIFVQGYS